MPRNSWRSCARRLIGVIPRHSPAHLSSISTTGNRAQPSSSVPSATTTRPFSTVYLPARCSSRFKTDMTTGLIRSAMRRKGSRRSSPTVRWMMSMSESRGVESCTTVDIAGLPGWASSGKSLPELILQCNGNTLHRTDKRQVTRIVPCAALSAGKSLQPATPEPPAEKFRHCISHRLLKTKEITPRLRALDQAFPSMVRNTGLAIGQPRPPKLDRDRGVL